jgi:hypothetical protein
LRTLRYLKSAPSVTFENEDGSLAVSLEAKNLRRVFLVNITLADLGHVSARLNSARAMGLLEGREWPWSVFINDLRIISEIIESPAEFILFLERRLGVNNHPAIATFDEVDYLGMFLRDGLYFEAEDLKGLHRFSPVGYTVDIERYYDHRAGRVSTGEKPRLNVSNWYRTLTQNIEKSRVGGATHAAVTLLALDGSRQKELENWYTTYSKDTEVSRTPHTLTLVAKEGPSIVIVMVAPGDEKTVAKTTEYARMKRLQANCEMLVMVALQVPGGLPSHVEILEGEIDDSVGLQGKVAAFTAAKFKDHIERLGMPARNEPCPCNSGHKFKKCCYFKI